jgi:hypothetical protein
MKTINFNLNWNAKLYCNCFTTIRPFNEEKFQLHENYQIRLNGVDMGEVELVYMVHFKLDQLKDSMSLLDMGYLAKYGKQILADLYPELQNIGEETFTYMVLERIKKDFKHNDQLNENRDHQPIAFPVPERLCNVCIPLDGANRLSYKNI